MATKNELILGKATARIGEARYAVNIHVGRHEITGDEPEVVGGKDVGPSPFGLLLSSLGACTAATLKMYADRHGWLLDALTVELRFLRSATNGDHIERCLQIEGALDKDQRTKLADVAERTPVTLVIKGGVAIHTQLADVKSDIQRNTLPPAPQAP